MGSGIVLLFRNVLEALGLAGIVSALGPAPQTCRIRSHEPDGLGKTTQFAFLLTCSGFDFVFSV